MNIITLFLISIQATLQSNAEFSSSSSSEHAVCQLGLNDIAILCRVQPEDGAPATNINYTSIVPTTIKKAYNTIEIKVKDNAEKINDKEFQNKLCKELPDSGPASTVLGECEENIDDARAPAVCRLDVFDLQTICGVEKADQDNEKLYIMDFTSQPIRLLFHNHVVIQVGKDKFQTWKSYEEFYHKICDRVASIIRAYEYENYRSEVC